jgi:hypothetical protein
MIPGVLLLNTPHGKNREVALKKWRRRAAAGARGQGVDYVLQRMQGRKGQ